MRESIYKFDGKNSNTVFKERVKPTKQKFLLLDMLPKAMG